MCQTTQTLQDDGDKPRADAETSLQREPHNTAALETLSACLPPKRVPRAKEALPPRREQGQAGHKEGTPVPQAGPQCPARLRAQDTRPRAPAGGAGAAGRLSSCLIEATASKPVVPTRGRTCPLATQPGPDTSAVVMTGGRGWDGAKHPTGPRAAPQQRPAGTECPGLE